MKIECILNSLGPFLIFGVSEYRECKIELDKNSRQRFRL